MSGLKKFKNIAKKTYEQIPKKKIIGKAGTYVAKKIIGGPYLEIGNVFYKKAKKKAMEYAGKYAYEKLVRSEYARKNVNAIPMTIISLIIRIVFNFLLISRTKTGTWWLDFIFSIIITIIITLLSPFFYTSIKAHRDGFMYYTNIFLNGLLEPGDPEYIERLKNRVLIITGIILIIILQFVEINSMYVQVLVVHSLITGIISNMLQQWINSMRNRIIYIGMTYNYDESHQLGFDNYITIPYKKINYCHTKNRILLGLKPQRAKIISNDKLKDYIMIELGIEFTKNPRLLTIIDDYSTK